MECQQNQKDSLYLLWIFFIRTWSFDEFSTKMREYELMKTALSLYLIYNYMASNSNKDYPHHDKYLNNKKYKERPISIA